MTAQSIDSTSHRRDSERRRVDQAYVANANGVVLIQVRGLGSMNVAPSVQAFCDEVMARKRTRFAFDLGPCRGMDSTFMGMLVGLSMQLNEDEADEDGWVCLFNTSSHHERELTTVGADRFVRIKSDLTMEPLEWEPLPTGRTTPEARLALIRHAHENLIQIDERNEARFGPFLESLVDELEE
jgi:anti-anti-sigma regulatory factor